MTINLVVAVTDADWHAMLRHRPDLPKVNFWAPSARSFQALRARGCRSPVSPPRIHAGEASTRAEKLL